MIDYRELLKKYMRHIDKNAGGPYIDPYLDVPDIAGLSDEESLLLKSIAEELENE